MKRGLLLLLVVLVSSAQSHSVVLQLQCGVRCDAIAAVENSLSPGPLLHAQTSGRIVIPLSALSQSNSHVSNFVHLASPVWSFPEVLVTVASRSPPEVRCDGVVVPPSPDGSFAIRPLGPVAFYEVRLPFAWRDLLSSPMVLIGVVTMGMMLVLQLLIRSMGSLDEVRKELRGESAQQREAA